MNLQVQLRDALGAAQHLVVSRAVSPEIRTACEALGAVVEAPTLHGRAVWEAAPAGTAVVETPNWWGRLEVFPAARPFCVVDRRRGVDIGGALRLGDPTGWSSRVATVRRCLRAAAQLRGVGAAHDDPEAPWAVLLLPFAAESVAVHCAATGTAGVVALAPRVPELPGGLRIEASEAAGSEWCAAVVASIRHARERSGAT